MQVTSSSNSKQSVSGSFGRRIGPRVVGQVGWGYPKTLLSFYQNTAQDISIQWWEKLVSIDQEGVSHVWCTDCIYILRSSPLERSSLNISPFRPWQGVFNRLRLENDIEGCSQQHRVTQSWFCRLTIPRRRCNTRGADEMEVHRRASCGQTLNHRPPMCSSVSKG